VDVAAYGNPVHGPPAAVPVIIFSPLRPGNAAVMIERSVSGGERLPGWPSTCFCLRQTSEPEATNAHGAYGLLFHGAGVPRAASLRRSCIARAVIRAAPHRLQRPRPGTATTHRFLERLGDGLIALDQDWRCVYVNRQAARLFGRNPEELLGHIWTVFSAECRRALPAALPAESYLRALQPAGPAREEFEGTTFLVELPDSPTSGVHDDTAARRNDGG
jgi:PAS domain S-box-containing protein